MSQESSAEKAWLYREANFAASIDADQAEISALRFGISPIQEGARDDKRTGGIADSATGGRNPTERSISITIKAEEIGAAIAEELRRRALILGPNYPFKIEGAKIRYEPNGSRVYEFCLCASVSTSLTKKPFNSIPPAFERLCCKVSTSLFGVRSKSIRTGWPRSLAKDKMPVRAKELFSKIHRLTGEWYWQPEADLPADPDPKYFKEQGLDLLTWICMPDGRVGGFFVLGQCACGKTEWFEKRNEPDLKILKRWFRPMTVADPVKSLFVPFHIANASSLIDVSTTAFLLDRARIVLISSTESKNWHASFAKENETLIKLVLQGSGIRMK